MDTFYKKLFLFSLLLIPILTACESAKQVQVLEKPSSKSIPGFPRESYAGENINGEFPEVVYIKTRTQTFNTYHYYVLKDGLIWYKGVTKESGPEDWILFMETGLPHNEKNKEFYNPDYICEISADADELVAISREGQFYRIPFDWIFSRKNKVWYQGQGWPKEEPLYVDERIGKNLGWALGKRNEQVLYYEDTFGNQHHNGTQEIATTYVLLEDGQEICYADTGLPADWSRNYIGPERGKFKAITISSSASTMFLMNEAGEMYTRIADFDIIGCDPMFFKYTYIPYKSDVPGTNYKSNLTPWALPPEQWRKQVGIPLEGKAGITRYITILQNGHGNGARELRVAGYDEQGRVGYWTKGINGTRWNFVEAPLKISRGDVLDAGKYTDGIGPRGSSLDVVMQGSLWTDNVNENEWQYKIEDFNLLEGGCKFIVTWNGESCIMLLHPVEMWTYLKRDYLPGRNGSPKVFFVTLEIPLGAMEGLSQKFAAALGGKFSEINKKLFYYIMEATTDFIVMQPQNAEKKNQIYFLTAEGVSDYYPDFKPGLQTVEFEEMVRYNSPEYMLQGGPVFTRDNYAEMVKKIELNKGLQKELQQRINEFESLKKSASNSRIAYSAMDVISHITLLYLIDVPKIYTMTRFGGEIMSANDVYINQFSNTRIWLDSKLLEMLDLRITFYSNMAKQLASGVEKVSLPPGYSESARGYWQLANFPDNLDGTFSFDEYNTFAYLQDSPLDYNFFGWILEVKNNDTVLTFLIEPEELAKTIYEHHGILPSEKPYNFKSYITLISAGSSSEGRQFYDNTIGTIEKPGKRIEADISYDGKEFTIQKKRFLQQPIIFFKGKIK